MDLLTADTLPWLRQYQQRWRAALASGRPPHSVMIVSAPGLGAEHLAVWMAGFTLCERAVDGPCRICSSCVLLRADSHPDYHVVRLDGESKQIKVDQVRELIAKLALKSYRRGYKVGVIEGAEALNANGANAFLKTLEEPAADTLLVIVARPSHRLPATVASRCLRLALRVPPRSEALEWLRTHGEGAAARAEDAAAVLALAGGAPLAATGLTETGVAALDADMTASMLALGRNAADVTLLADHWVRNELPLRIAWLENWITGSLYCAVIGPATSETAGRVRLPAQPQKAKIRALFDLLDGVRELRRLAATGINQQLALEALLLGGRHALTS